MNSYIFITDEGMTYQPGSASIEPDVNNLQVIGISEGRNANEAFSNILKENPWLKETSFKEIQAIELKHESYYKKIERFFI